MPLLSARPTLPQLAWSLVALALAIALVCNVYTPRHLGEYFTGHLVAVLERQIALQGRETRAASLGAIADTRKDLLLAMQAESRAWRALADEDLGAIAVIADQRLAKLTATADARLASIQGSADRHLVYLNQHVAAELHRSVDGLRGVTDPAGVVATQLAEAAPGILDPLTDCEGNPSCFENRWRGLTFDAEQTMRTIQRAAPAIAASAEKIGANSDRTTAASAQIAENFAVASKPLPGWARVLIQVAPAAASAGASAVGAAAAMGIFK